MCLILLIGGAEGYCDELEFPWAMRKQSEHELFLAAGMLHAPGGGRRALHLVACHLMLALQVFQVLIESKSNPIQSKSKSNQNEINAI